MLGDTGTKATDAVILIGSLLLMPLWLPVVGILSVASCWHNRKNLRGAS